MLKCTFKFYKGLISENISFFLNFSIENKISFYITKYFWIFYTYLVTQYSHTWFSISSSQIISTGIMNNTKVKQDIYLSRSIKVIILILYIYTLYNSWVKICVFFIGGFKTAFLLFKSRTYTHIYVNNIYNLINKKKIKV